MAAFKNKDNGTWYVQFRYTDWKGERQQKLKRGHLILSDAAQSCKIAVGHGLALGLAAHAVVVVVEVIDDGKSALIAVLPKIIVLIHGGKVHGLVNRASCRGAVTGVGNNDAGLLVALLVKGNTGSDRTAAADDGVVGINAEGEEEGVHGAAESSGEAVVLCKQCRL